MTAWCLLTPCLAKESSSGGVKFIVEDWKRPQLREKLVGKVLHATCGDNISGSQRKGRMW